MVVEALIYRVIYLVGPPRQILCDEATEFSSAIIQAILCMLNCRLKVISPCNHGSSKCERQIRTISEIIMKHLWGKGQMWPLFATTAAYAMNTFPSEALSGFSPFQLVFLRDPPDLTRLSFPKIDTIPVKHREYYNLLLARAQLIGRLLLEWRTKQVFKYKSRAKRYKNEEIFQDNQMVYLLALHASALQTNTTKFKQDFIGPLFIDTALDKMHCRMKDTLSGFSPFQLVFLRDPPNLTRLSFPKIDTILVKHREYYNLLLARAQLIGRLLLEWRTKQVLEYKSRAKRYKNEEIFQDNQMVY